MPADDLSFKPSRRLILQVISLGAAGFAVGLPAYAAPTPTPALPDDKHPASLIVLGPFVKVGADDKVTVLLKHIEFGQGVSTGLTTIVCDEMDARWKQMRFEHAPAEVPTYGNL